MTRSRALGICYQLLTVFAICGVSCQVLADDAEDARACIERCLQRCTISSRICLREHNARLWEVSVRCGFFPGNIRHYHNLRLLVSLLACCVEAREQASPQRRLYQNREGHYSLHIMQRIILGPWTVAARYAEPHPDGAASLRMTVYSFYNAWTGHSLQLHNHTNFHCTAGNTHV